MDSTRLLKLGQVVTSIAGRDSERAFIVVDIVDDIYVKLADGDLRRIDRPKLKKVKHLNASSSVIEDIADALEKGRKVTNERIKKALENFTYKGDGGPN